MNMSTVSAVLKLVFPARRLAELWRAKNYNQTGLSQKPFITAKGSAFFLVSIILKETKIWISGVSLKKKATTLVGEYLSE
ncbi:hypothetical protein [Gordoniibacillus kamchatkensis]|uniref:hypothetical protein n=1 Tax=Gordoniibacillus kamchatkensis TaxID=1590651 RepID=UPI0018CE57AC|nr:hypothetical protein [Paenibacillus sp. VKM B-2647]